MADLTLRYKGYESFLPVYKSRRRRPDRFKEVVLPVFPGYLFCRFDYNARLPILTTPGVLHIVGMGRIAVPVPEIEVESVRRLVSSGLPSEPWPYLEVGQRVYIMDGPLQGVAGLLSAVKNAQRLIVSVTLLQRAVCVEIDRRWVAPGAMVPGNIELETRSAV